MANPTLMRCLLAVALLSSVAHAQLSTTFYNTSCHSVEDIVWAEMKLAVNKERRTGASLLRLFFHDCFVQGCDASILLDDGGEKSAGPNADSVRGFDVIDTIKASVEKKCPGVAPTSSRSQPAMGRFWCVAGAGRPAYICFLNLLLCSMY
uniref:Uncharacterized protein n=1 Tax=Avena sativa TaxID=4498 RepID=A0ACD6AHX8_AVESA